MSYSNRPAHPQLTKRACRKACRQAYWNAGLWAIGNGLTSTTLVVYLALELRARGIAIALILAAPRLIGVLRMLTPVLIPWMGGRRSTCLKTYLASNLLLLALPICSTPGVLTASGSLGALVALWSAYHLLEYCGTVALCSWLGDLTPARLRGRLFGIRERWLTCGRIVGMGASGLFAYYWQTTTQGTAAPQIGYTAPAMLGALLMIASLWPLVRLPALTENASVQKLPPWSRIARPFYDGRFWRLLLFGICFSFANGLGQSAQAIYPKQVLGFHLLAILAMESLMRLGQSTVSPWLGRCADRFGNRPVMIVSQWIVSAGPAFYLLATPQTPWWLFGSWVAWTAYAGLNVTLPNLNIKLAGNRADSSAYLGAWFAISGVAYAVSTLAGGALLDYLAARKARIAMGPYELDYFDLFFALGVLLRIAAALFLLRLVEPSAWKLLEILRGKRA